MEQALADVITNAGPYVPVLIAAKAFQMVVVAWRR